jgi:hypothetical protein
VQVEEEQPMESLWSHRLDGEEVTGDDRRAWVRMNWRQVFLLGGGRLLTAKIRRMEVAEISAPTFMSSPLIRR